MLESSSVEGGYVVVEGVCEGARAGILGQRSTVWEWQRSASASESFSAQPTSVFNLLPQTRPAQPRKNFNICRNALASKALLHHRKSSSPAAHCPRAIDGGVSLADAVESKINRASSCSSNLLNPNRRPVVKHLVSTERFEVRVIFW